MNCLSAAQDLYRRTLERIPALTRRLEYLASLRDGQTHTHWGLARVYGPEATARALSEAHTQCFLSILTSYFPALLAEVDAQARSSGLDKAAFLHRLWEQRQQLVPLQDGGGSPKHLEWTLLVLWKIAEAQTRAAGRAA